MSPRTNDLVTVGLLALQALIAAIVLADPAELGLSTTLVRWLVVLTPVITILSNQMKALGAAGPGQSPIQQPPGTGGVPPLAADSTLTREGMPPPP